MDCLAPVNTDETYSRLRTTQTNIKPRDELQRRADIDQTSIRVLNQNKAKDSIKYNVMLIILIVLLLILTLVSIALSVATYSRSSSEQSKVQDQLNKTNNDVISVLRKLDTIQSYVSYNEISGQSNISQVLNKFESKLETIISLQTQYASLQTQAQCGPGLWHRLIYINMSNPTHQCPFAWREYNTNGVRACGRPTNSSGSCAAIRHFTSRQYSQVCGRVIGYQFASPDAFHHHVNSNSIDLDGINITHGINHSHIWSYVAGHMTTSQHESNCPCFNDDGQGTDPPSSVGDNYYCESGNPNYHTATLYTDDPLWDGQQCEGEGTCCTGTGINSPPWFRVQLPASTDDAIEVSICCDQSTDNEDVPVELVEIYMQ